MAADFYKELGVSRQATDDEIRKAYRKLASQYHPDRNQGNAEAEAKFKAINAAHTVLGDKQKRALYDEFGESGLRDGFNAGAARSYGGGRGSSGFAGGNLEDLFGGAGGGFGDLFGDVFRSNRAPPKGADAAATVDVDFVSAIRGASVSVRIPGVASEVTVRVPAGAGNGDKVRVAGHGPPGRRGGPPGDLVLTIKVAPHPFFEREGLDLKLKLPLSVGEAYHGAKVRVPTPEGDVTLTVPPGVKSGQTMRLRGRGVKRQSKVGDAYVTFLIQLPTSDSRKVKKAIDALSEETDLSAREEISF